MTNFVDFFQHFLPLAIIVAVFLTLFSYLILLL